MRSSWKSVALFLFCTALTACPGSDKTPPTVTLTSSGQTVNVGGSSKLSATAADEGGIKHVEFLEGDQSLSVDTAAPYEFVVSGFTAPGTRSFTARAVDIAGNSADSGVVKITVNDAGSPVIQSFKANPNPVEVLSNIELEVIASDDVKVTEVKILEGTQELKTFTAEPFKLSLNMNDLNTRTFSAVVKDATGNSARAELSVKAEDNVAPSVTLIPNLTLENNRIIKDTNLSFTATATDNFALAKLEFFVDGTLLGTSLNKPFNIGLLVDTSRVRSQEIKAVATDQAGKIAEVKVVLEVVNPVVQLAAGAQHTCALFANGEVRCWGANGSGQLGRGNTIGIDDSRAATPVQLGQPAKQITVGGTHNCALLVDSSVKCWGSNDSGQLGYGDTVNRGVAANDMVNLQALRGIKTAKQITAGLQHTCALLEVGAVLCWGNGIQGKLGYGNISAANILAPSNAPSSVNILGNTNATILEIRAGNQHTCALLSTQKVRCWGAGSSGALGYANEETIGDNESPSSAGDIVLGLNVVAPLGLSGSANHTCVVSSKNEVLCWGRGGFGRLGYGDENDVGDNETPLRAGIVNVGGAVQTVVTGGSHTCALLETGAVRCWGFGDAGQLGFGNTNNIGDDLNEFPSSAGDVSITPGNTVKVTQLVAGQNHTCALLENGSVKCWGRGAEGQLGYGKNVNETVPSNIGDDELPSSVGFLSFF